MERHRIDEKQRILGLHSKNINFILVSLGKMSSEIGIYVEN